MEKKLKKLRADIKERLFTVIPDLKISLEEFELIMEPILDYLLDHEGHACLCSEVSGDNKACPIHKSTDLITRLREWV